MESRLITPELEKRLTEYPLGSQDGKGKNAMCVAVFHIGRIRWYVLEGGREGSDYTIFCIACGMAETEYGYASVREMEAIEEDGGKFGIPMKFKVENLHRFTPRPIGEVADEELQEFLSRFEED